MRAGYAALTCAGLVLIAGCETTTRAAPRVGDLGLIKAAYATTTAARTALMVSTSDLSPNGPGDQTAPLNFTGHFMVDFAHSAIEEFGTQQGQPGSDETRKIGSDFYFKPAPGTGMSPPLAKGKQWLHEVDPDGPADFDPTWTLRQLTVVSRSVTRLGTAEVLGQASTHYRVIVDSARYAATLPAARACMFQLQQKLRKRAATWPIDIWLDRHGRLTRIQLREIIGDGAVSGPNVVSDGSTATDTTTTEFYDYGAPVTITAPPAALTQDDPTAMPTGCPTL